MNIPPIIIPSITVPHDTSVGNVCDVLGSHGRSYTIDQASWVESFPYKPQTKVLLGHDNKYIYAWFIVRSKSVKGVYLHDQEPVSSDSCVEIFLQPEVGGEYWNFEFNCLGTLNASHRIIKPESTKLTPQEASTILRFPSLHRESFDETDGITEWDLMIMIPLALMNIETSEFPVQMRGNIYSCASGMKDPYYMSYYPIDSPKPNYHLPETFGQIVLE